MDKLNDAYLNRTILSQNKTLLSLPATPVIAVLAFNIGLFMTLRSVLVFLLVLSLSLTLIYVICKDDPKGLAAWQLAIQRRLLKNIDCLDPATIEQKSFLLTE